MTSPQKPRATPAAIPVDPVRAGTGRACGRPPRLLLSHGMWQFVQRLTRPLLRTTSRSATRLAGADVLLRRDPGSAASRDRINVEAHRLRNRVVPAL